MQLDPYLHLQMHEQEIRRTIKQNALEREARAAKAEAVKASSPRLRVNRRQGRLATLAATLAGITRLAGTGR